MSTRQKKSEDTGQSTIAVLEHLSGPSIGLESLLFGEELEVRLGPDRLLAVGPARRRKDSEPDGVAIARLVRTDGTYRLEAADGSSIWVNGRLIRSAELIGSDIIEFGEKGPLSRYRLVDGAAHSRRYFTEICDDCWDYIRTSRKPLPERLARAVGEGTRRLASETTFLHRTAIVVALMLLGLVTYQQYKINVLQQIELTSGQSRIEDFARSLARTREEALTPADLARLQETLSRDLSSNISRLEALEKRSTAAETVIRVSAPSILFLQGSYGLREAASGRVLRHVLGDDGTPLVAPTGTPLLSLDGDGPPAERYFTGTGFAVGDGSLVATNRHVAVPWQSDDATAQVASQGLEPYPVRLLAYPPGTSEARQAELVKVADDADLAVLRLAPGEMPLVPLPIATDSIASGAAVIVMGYPTGLRSMLARSGPAFVERLQREKQTNFWTIAKRLAENGLIRPLSSLGIVAQLTPEYLVYDAATTRGGSGGPVLDLRGEVVAINAAILPEYGGSNLGVPVQKLRDIIAAMGATPSATSQAQ